MTQTRDEQKGSAATRAAAMQALVGLWKNRRDFPSSEAYVRKLRRGKRLLKIASR